MLEAQLIETELQKTTVSTLALRRSKSAMDVSAPVRREDRVNVDLVRVPVPVWKKY